MHRVFITAQIRAAAFRLISDSALFSELVSDRKILWSAVG